MPDQQRSSRAFQARQVDRPEPGFFRLRLVRRGPFVPAVIRLDFDLYTVDIDGERRGQAAFDPLNHRDLMNVWTHGIRIDQAEFRAMLARKASRPDAMQPVDLTKLPSVF